jgi:HD-like signal output (HDOD) protein
MPVIDDNPQLKALVDKIDELAVLPHVVFKVLEISGDTDSPASEMERAIIVDPGFSTKVLSLANSAMYGLPRKVTSIKEAVTFLGYRAVRTLAMTVGVFDLFVGKTDVQSLRRRQWWRHSVDTAVCARWLATTSGKVRPDDAYTSGLLHNIGRTLLDKGGGTDYSTVQQLIDGGLSDWDAETKVYGCDHVDLAIAAARKWGFPDELMAGLDYLEEPKDVDADPLRRACTALGSAIATLVTTGRSGDAADLSGKLPAWAMQVLGFDAEKADSLVEDGSRAISAAQLQFS